MQIKKIFEKSNRKIRVMSAIEYILFQEHGIEFSQVPVTLKKRLEQLVGDLLLNKAGASTKREQSSVSGTAELVKQGLLEFGIKGELSELTGIIDEIIQHEKERSRED